MQKTRVWSLVLEGPLEVEVATHSSILAGQFHGQRSLAGYSPWSHEEWDTTEWLNHPGVSPVLRIMNWFEFQSKTWGSRPLSDNLLLAWKTQLLARGRGWGHLDFWRPFIPTTSSTAVVAVGLAPLAKQCFFPFWCKQLVFAQEKEPKSFSAFSLKTNSPLFSSLHWILWEELC